jgi:hypothetical protein
VCASPSLRSTLARDVALSSKACVPSFSQTLCAWIQSVDSFVQPALSISVIMQAMLCAFFLNGASLRLGAAIVMRFTRVSAALRAAGNWTGRMQQYYSRATSVKRKNKVTDAYFLTVLGVGAGEPFFKRVLSRITFLCLFFVSIAIATEFRIKLHRNTPSFPRKNSACTLPFPRTPNLSPGCILLIFIISMS